MPDKPAPAVPVLCPDEPRQPWESPRKRLSWLPPMLCLGVLWFILIDQLRSGWAADPQYSYGFVVPVLCLGLAWKRWSEPKTLGAANCPGQQLPAFRSSVLGTIALGALLLWPTRLVLEANPDWRLLNWLLAVEVVSLTLALAYSFGGWKRVRQFTFPVAYILVAVPWPFTIERPLIQGLTRTNVAFAIEALGCIGIPAAQHGNVIEITAGTIGVDEACSGIRSFQSSLMVSLFFGEFYRMSRWRRILLVPIGFLLAIAFNMVRTSFLTLTAAKKGVPAVSHYHDQAGLTILLACCASLWVASWLLQLKGNPADIRKHKPEVSPLQISGSHFRSSRVALAFLAWLLLVELSVEAWYRLHESRAAAVSAWTVPWPPQYAAFVELPISERAREILGYDEGHSGRWQSEDGATWTINYFKWNPGKMQAWLAGIHRPDVCMAAMGYALREQEDRRRTIRVGSVDLPFQVYTYEEAGRTLHVFHCFWEQRSTGRNLTPVEPDRSQRLRAVVKGQRNLGQQTLQISVSGIRDQSEAIRALGSQLQKALRIAPLQ